MKDFGSLNQNAEFRRLYKRGKSCVRKNLVLYAMRNRSGQNRLGITAGKKVGGAVVRNRAKRRLRALYQINVPRLQPGYDVCLVARGQTAKAEFCHLQQDFLSACKYVGIWNDEVVAD